MNCFTAHISMMKFEGIRLLKILWRHFAMSLIHYLLAHLILIVSLHLQLKDHFERELGWLVHTPSPRSTDKHAAAAWNDIIDIRAATNNHLIGPMPLTDFTDLILISSEMEYCCGVSAPAPEMATDSGMSPWPSVTQNNNKQQCQQSISRQESCGCSVKASR